MSDMSEAETLIMQSIISGLEDHPSIALRMTSKGGGLVVLEGIVDVDSIAVGIADKLRTVYGLDL